MKRLVFLFSILTFIVFSCKKVDREQTPKLDKTILKGCVIGRDSDTLLLVKSIGDARSETLASIPIVNWEFNFEFKTDTIQAYDLIFKDEFDNGGWMPIRFFPEKDTIIMTLYSMDAYRNTEITGGKSNIMYDNYQKEISIPYMTELNEFYKIFDSIPYNTVNSSAYNDLVNKLQIAEMQEEKVVLYKSMDDLKANNLHRSDFGKQIDSQVNVIQNAYWDKKYAFISKNPSIVSYSLLIDDIMSLEYNPAPKEKIITALNELKNKYPNHTYSALAENLWIGFTELQPGGQYINFNAPDINDVSYELKSFVDKNDIVLLDLWATWCGPCIARSRLMRPVYDEYKDKGFEIVGVAGENKNLNAYKKFMAKEQWPWKSLIELDKRNKIWEKYNVMNGGGGMFLIDGSGKILAVDPSADEVKSILKDRLKNQSIKL
ncbi:TlpA family protein disulfide reductase [Hanstruepera ponticola]|uniref:TlpA family protein disulfide reductase n=1 Tax=Hanstruepera ponticola TaxID=2042995 RepID=UPI000CF0A6DF|nr:TlpA disulfide reductase family protein [Hanstruepera ponticola]